MKQLNPLTLTIFGATGDLYQNKLANSLFNLFSLGLLPEEFRIIGFARRSLSDEEFRDFTKEAILEKNKNTDKDMLSNFLESVEYMQGDLENVESFKNLSEELGMGDEKLGACSNKLLYLAVPPTLYGIIFKNIYDAGLSVPCASGIEDKEKWARILVEKPFGKDINEAEHLDKLLGELFDEPQIFRIDHYLGKEVVLNILSLHFSENLESPWNDKNIEKVRIVFHEKDTIGKRGSLYDGLGILRDIGQNHMLQMLALVVMEKPEQMESEAIHHERRKVLEKITVVHPNKIVRGQYEGYLNELNVKPDSKTETFFRVFLEVQNKRWKGVNFELEAGKALGKSETFIEFYFKDSSEPHKFFISSHNKGTDAAYDKVLSDSLAGDQTIFTTTAEIMAEWKVTEDIIEKWQSTPLVVYKKGSAGADIK